MEILISIIVGIVLMETYAWLDPLAMWIVRRAAKELPEDRAEEFTDQWEADLAAVPNSIMKVCYVFRDCLLPIKDIAQTMFRDDFEDMADKSDLVFEKISGVVDRLMTQSEDVVQKTEITTIKFISTLDFSLERLQQFHDNKDHDACSAIERVRALNPPLAAQLSDYASAVERNHAMIIGFAANVREPLARIAEASLRVKGRLRDDSPLVEEDVELLEALYAPFADVNAALDTFHIELPSDDLSPGMKAASEAIRAAVRAVKRGGPKQLGSGANDSSRRHNGTV
jgi:hypothetical protein